MKSTKQIIIDDLRQENEKLIGRVYDLRAKLKEATDRLATICDGSYYPTECEGILSSDSRGKRTAALGLAKIARMAER